MSAEYHHVFVGSPKVICPVEKDTFIVAMGALSSEKVNEGGGIEYKIKYIPDEREGLLKTGVDIVEEPNMGIKILFTSNLGSIVDRFVQMHKSLRDSGRFAWCDYVAFEHLGNDGEACGFLGSNSTKSYFYFIPRVFRGMPIDDLLEENRGKDEAESNKG